MLPVYKSCLPGMAASNECKNAGFDNFTTLLQSAFQLKKKILHVQTQCKVLLFLSL